MSQKMMNDELQIRIERDRKPDLFIAHLREITNPLETRVVPLFDGNILFKVDSITDEVSECKYPCQKPCQQKKCNEIC
ncbi:MAG: hypothetical protein GY749_00260 [Desulfobacteraceae bacterium]|nr:hypothetical protein [Desulfobacteraceae bacterium]